MFLVSNSTNDLWTSAPRAIRDHTEKSVKPKWMKFHQENPVLEENLDEEGICLTPKNAFLIHPGAERLPDTVES